MNLDENTFILLVIKSLKEPTNHDFQLIVDELQPYDIAMLYKNLPEKHISKMLLYLNTSQIALLIQELEQKDQLSLLDRLGVRTATDVMDLMENDDLAELLSSMTIAQTEEFLGLMNTEESESVQSLMNYPAETAGRIMTNRFVWIRKYYTVREAVEKLKEFANLAENIYYLYVIDENKKLVGVVSHRDLLIASGDDVIEDIMFTRVISVPVDMDQEKVAHLIKRYDFFAVPVVDDEGTLMGIVTVDDVIDVFVQEADEDIGKLTASGKSIDFTTNALVAAGRRLPWLILLLFLGMLSGSIISGFEETIAQSVALVFFMPMIAGMTGNTGTQSLAVVVRGLVSENPDRVAVIKLVLREFGVGAIIGTTCGFLVAIIAYFWQANNIYLGLVVGFSLFITLILGTLAGTIIPLLLHRFKVDPAVASGPLITTLNDILSLFIYFGTASFFIAHLS